jgi:hypothetical protein
MSPAPLLTGQARLVKVNRDGYASLDVALLSNTVVEGALARGRIERAEPALSIGQGVLAGSILIMLPALVEGVPEDCSDLYAADAWTDESES